MKTIERDRADACHQRAQYVAAAQKRGARTSPVGVYPYPDNHEDECASLAPGCDCTCPASWPGGWLHERGIA